MYTYLAYINTVSVSKFHYHNKVNAISLNCPPILVISWKFLESSLPPSFSVKRLWIQMGPNRRKYLNEAARKRISRPPARWTDLFHTQDDVRDLVSLEAPLPGDFGHSPVFQFIKASGFGHRDASQYNSQGLESPPTATCHGGSS